MADRPPVFKKGFPGLALWADGWGWIEIGQDEHSRSLVRILDEGGMVWGSPDKMQNLEKALRAADESITKWIKEND